MTIKLLSIKRVDMDDMDPVLSHLDQFKDSKDPEEQKYYKENQKRLALFHEGYLTMIGIKAQAEIIVNGVIQRISSGGIWGIESDSGQSFFDEVYKEQLSTLRDILLELGVTKDNLYKVNGV